MSTNVPHEPEDKEPAEPENRVIAFSDPVWYIGSDAEERERQREVVGFSEPMIVIESNRATREKNVKQSDDGPAT